MARPMKPRAPSTATARGRVSCGGMSESLTVNSSRVGADARRGPSAVAGPRVHPPSRGGGRDAGLRGRPGPGRGRPASTPSSLAPLVPGGRSAGRRRTASRCGATGSSRAAGRTSPTERSSRTSAPGRAAGCRCRRSSWPVPSRCAVRSVTPPRMWSMCTGSFHRDSWLWWAREGSRGWSRRSAATSTRSRNGPARLLKRRVLRRASTVTVMNEEMRQVVVGLGVAPEQGARSPDGRRAGPDPAVGASRRSGSPGGWCSSAGWSRRRASRSCSTRSGSCPADLAWALDIAGDGPLRGGARGRGPGRSATGSSSTASSPPTDLARLLGRARGRGLPVGAGPLRRPGRPPRRPAGGHGRRHPDRRE